MDLAFVLPDDPAAVSGGNLYNRFLIEALARQGASPSVLTYQEARLRLARGAPGIYLIDSLLHERIPALAAHIRPGQRLLLIVHLLPSLDPTRPPDAAASEPALLAGIDGFVVTSSFTRERLAQRHPGLRPIFVVPPALAVTPCGLAPPATGFQGLLVGNVIALKGVLALLHALDRMLSEHDRFAIEIVGRRDLDPAYAEACARFAGGSPRLRDKIRFSGPVRPDAMGTVYARSNVFISASAMETYGMALHEARAFGLFILALRAGNVPAHVRSGREGLLCGSVAELARACVVLIRTPAKLRDVVERARAQRLVETYSWNDAAVCLLQQLAIWGG